MAFGQKLQDASIKGSPVALSIKVDPSDAQPYVHAHSNSPKGILALVAFVTFSDGKGQVSPLTVNADYVFKLEPLMFGEERDIAPAYWPSGLITSKFSSVDRVVTVKTESAKITEAVGQVLFVQYEDGSIWGNPEAAKQMLDARPQKLAFLKHLVETYYESGQEAFDGILNEPKPGSPEWTVAGCLESAAEYHKTTPIDQAKKQLAAAQSWHASGIF